MKRVNLPQFALLSAVTLSLATLPFTLPAAAQTGNTTGTTTESATRSTDEDRDFDWGLLGLLGLAGLAGLRKKQETTVSHHETVNPSMRSR
jgi:MYXO-CTERM domain-containing protein